MPSNRAIERLQRMLNEQVNGFGAVGAIVGLDFPGKEAVYLTAGTQMINGEPLDPSNLYQIASQTKTFVAVAICLMARDGRIALGDPVRRYLDIALDGRIEIRHLITNSSGLPEFWKDKLEGLDVAIEPRNLIADALKKDCLFAPGAHFDYSNTGWVIAAMILDVVFPGGYAQVIRERIFEPLGLTNSYVAQGYPAGQLAHGYLNIQPGAVPRPVEKLFSPTQTYGAGDIVSNAPDMLRFFRALASPNNPIGLTLPEMASDWMPPSIMPVHEASIGTFYGLGIERRYWGGLEVWGHPGRTLGYGSSTWFVPSTRAVVTMAHMHILDITEDRKVLALRYNPHLFFTEAMATAHALAEMNVQHDRSLATVQDRQ